jgi:hypothetical protein
VGYLSAVTDVVRLFELAAPPTLPPDGTGIPAVTPSNDVHAPLRTFVTLNGPLQPHLEDVKFVFVGRRKNLHVR